MAATMAVGAGVRVGAGTAVGLSTAVGEGTGVEVCLRAGVGSAVGVARDTGFVVEVAVGVLVRFRNSDRGCSGPPVESVHATNNARETKVRTANGIRTLHLQRIMAVIPGRSMSNQPTISILVSAPWLSQGSFVAQCKAFRPGAIIGASQVF